MWQVRGILHERQQPGQDIKRLIKDVHAFTG
jgi:hypothetical protein